MIELIWPIALVVLSNTVYQVCSKSIPAEIDPLAALVVTYLVGAAAAAILYFAIGKGGNILKEFSHLNWATVVLGIVIVGLEVGWIFAYRAGWEVSTAFIVHSAILAAVLVVVGFALYQEPISASKIIGIIICLVGLYFINR